MQFGIGQLRKDEIATYYKGSTLYSIIKDFQSEKETLMLEVTLLFMGTVPCSIFKANMTPVQLTTNYSSIISEGMSQSRRKRRRRKRKEEMKKRREGRERGGQERRKIWLFLRITNGLLGEEKFKNVATFSRASALITSPNCPW